jgi:hypothetical protein
MDADSSVCGQFAAKCLSARVRVAGGDQWADLMILCDADTLSV